MPLFEVEPGVNIHYRTWGHGPQRVNYHFHDLFDHATPTFGEIGSVHHGIRVYNGTMVISNQLFLIT
jgi:hypothetical protein